MESSQATWKPEVLQQQAETSLLRNSAHGQAGWGVKGLIGVVCSDSVNRADELFVFTAADCRISADSFICCLCARQQGLQKHDPSGPGGNVTKMFAIVVDDT